MSSVIGTTGNWMRLKKEQVKKGATCGMVAGPAHGSLQSRKMLPQNTGALHLPSLFMATQNSIFGSIQNERRDSVRCEQSEGLPVVHLKVEFMMKTVRSSFAASRKLMTPEISSKASSTTRPWKSESSSFRFWFLKSYWEQHDFRITRFSTHE